MDTYKMFVHLPKIKIMYIEIEVKSSGIGGSTIDTIKITQEEIEQLACNKARGKYMAGVFNNIQIIDNTLKIISNGK